MAIEKKIWGRREIDLDGPAGNAHNLLGVAQLWAKQLGMDREGLMEEMTSGNYLHLLKTFDKYFGDYVTLVTENEEYLKAFENE